ncbi:MAG: ParB N-terminal domain-containing protein [Candidatus Thermoplasmatota archaeon]|jgi:hypothetical protein|nr:ParB N-terminal domain-containing protein [Candidatus Thermoplasmatota archaeon]|tara:strand:+ start:478 stop:873 length:396 start_codon:yes stop_codon:yes gene_type:complete
MEIILIEVSALRPHEEIKPKSLKKMVDAIQKRGGYIKPILIDRVSRAILDGHHRYNSALQLKLRLIPAIEVNYLEDESIEVRSWPGKEHLEIDKQAVLKMAMSSEVYPPKSSKHSISVDYPSCFYPISELE